VTLHREYEPYINSQLWQVREEWKRAQMELLDAIKDDVKHWVNKQVKYANSKQ